jgi:outer membrane protein OmpA-like peptidoglycan-associated protein
MHRLWWLAPVMITPAAVALSASSAAAEPTQLGAWIGPRLFSASRLGFIDDAPAHPELQSATEFGARVAHPMLPWLVPELELAMSPTNTNAVGGAAAANVFWLEPRVHVRFELMPGRRLQPFAVIGGGAPISLSGAGKTFGTGITGDGYVGGGLRFDTTKGFLLRFDARVAILPAEPGASFGATAELDIGFGIELQLGGGGKKSGVQIAHTDLPDRDGDGIPDDQDKCPDRPEDFDGFEDQDGCPDIDNDLDGVLDIADKCPNVAETYNGFEDDDGCPDVLPGDVDALRGTIEGLLYGDGETAVRDSAQASIKRIAKTMAAHPSIRVVLIGHTDDTEAKQFAQAGQPADNDALSADLSRARAEAVKNALVAAGAVANRVLVEGKGAEEPVADNTKPRGRLANRRVEIKLYVPPR